MRGAARALLCLLVVLLLCPCAALAAESPQEQEQVKQDILSEQLEQIDFSQYNDFLYGDDRLNPFGDTPQEAFLNILRGKIDLNPLGVLKGLLGLLSQYLLSAFSDARIILSILIICAAVSAIAESKNNGVGKVADVVCGLCLIGFIVPVFLSFAKGGLSSQESLMDLLRVLTPGIGLFLGLSGKAVSAAAFPTSVFASVFLINELMQRLFLPLLYAYTALSCTGAMTGDDRLKKLADFFKGVFVWGISICFTVLGAILAVSRSMLAVADSAAFGTLKYTISAAVPIVGSIIAHSADIIFGCAGTMTSALGIFGVLCVVSVCAIPFIRVGSQALIYKILSVSGVLLGEGSASRVLNCFFNAFSMLFAINCGVSVLFVVAMSMLA